MKIFETDILNENYIHKLAYRKVLQRDANVEEVKSKFQTLFCTKMMFLNRTTFDIKWQQKNNH